MLPLYNSTFIAGLLLTHFDKSVFGMDSRRGLAGSASRGLVGQSSNMFVYYRLLSFSSHWILQQPCQNRHEVDFWKKLRGCMANSQDS
ncbi:hypothetical protein BKA64DRAFT_649828 [Cadophora sp. MPI-SDFR-AT-0126]|nr:hypothetical protein BKA64DRAFT_649828 [Leotiomycetes sp. MPI-SDFR-AT-0126]